MTRCLIIVAMLAAGCTGNGYVAEVGAVACSDSLDNDGDGLFDCGDPDCKPLAFCSPSGDSGPENDQGWPPDQQQVVDQQPQPDKFVPDPDQGVLDQGKVDGLTTKSSYGLRCTNPGPKNLCVDGQTICTQGKAGLGIGICTYPCVQSGPACPAGPVGTKPHCGLFVDYGSGLQSYCVFGCPACPSGTQCYGANCY